MRARWQGNCLWIAVMLVLSRWRHAQSAPPEDAYKQLFHVNENIRPLGAHPFDEGIGRFDGVVPLDVIGITLPVNGPTIQVGREQHPVQGAFVVGYTNPAYT